MQEYYIRKSEDADARGPFSMEQLSSLAETGQVDPQTTYYDVDKEEWLPIAANDALRAALFPEKRKLRVKAKEVVNPINAPADPSKKEKVISVTDMLDAAEGLTEDSKTGVSQITQSKVRAVQIGLYSCSLALLAHSIALGVGERDIILGAEFEQVLLRPLFYASIIDLVFSFVLFLGVAEAYPAIRVRSAAMVGFLTFSYLHLGDPRLVVAAGLSAAGTYALTYLTNLKWVLLAALLGIGGAVWLAWLHLGA